LLYSGVFNDVTADSKYSDIVEGLVNASIIDMEMSHGGSIGIDSPITKEEAISLMVRGLRNKKSATSIGTDVHFTDKDEISPWALTYVEVAVANGLVEDGGELNPKSEISADEAKAMIEKMDKVYRSLPLLAGSGLMRIEFPVLEQPEGVERPAMLDEDYKLVFDDEFDGDTLDTTKWGYNYSWGHSHNHAGYCAEENVIVKDGILTLLGENKQHPDAVGKEGTFNNKKYPLVYTTGAINTHHKFNFNYGYFEARLKMPKGKGMWPAWWMLKDGWPPEIDMLEILCSRPTQLRVNCHYGPAWNQEKSHEQVLNLDFDTTDDFHVYGFEWTPKYMKYYVDGVQVGHAFTDKTALAQCTGMYMILNLAIDGWDGTPDDTTVWPAEYQCDWVRVWQKNEY
ncbi:MAG: family 16 glycosylhydrolase, partial [Clostridia bacterium]